MELKTGNLNNRERKFIPVRKSNLEKYIKGLTKVESYKVTQFYSGDYKYRKFEDSENTKYTRSKKQGDITVVEEIEENEFLKNMVKQFIVKKRTKYTSGEYTVEIDEFSKPNEFTMVEVSTDTGRLEDYIPEKTFVEVTDNSIYENKNIANGSIQKSNVIVEGTDAVGKTTTIEKLLADGIICQDRCEKIISKNMLFDISHEKRGEEIYHEYFSKPNNSTIIFLVNFDEKELMRRVMSRGKISDFDLEAYRYGLLYKETYDYMCANYNIGNKLRLVDCTGLGIEEQYQKVRKSVLKEMEYER